MTWSEFGAEKGQAKKARCGEWSGTQHLNKPKKQQNETKQNKQKQKYTKALKTPFRVFIK